MILAETAIQAALNAAADAVTARLAGGVIRIYGGAAPPAPETAVNAQPVLAELRFGDPAFGSARDGAARAQPIAPDPAARATGVPTWFRALDASDRAVLDGRVGADGDLVLDATTIEAGAEVSITELIYRQPR